MVSGVECGETGRSHWLEITRVGVGVTDSCLLLQHFHIFALNQPRIDLWRTQILDERAYWSITANSSREKSVSSLPVSSSRSNRRTAIKPSWNMESFSNKRRSYIITLMSPPSALSRPLLSALNHASNGFEVWMSDTTRSWCCCDSPMTLLDAAHVPGDNIGSRRERSTFLPLPIKH